MQTGQPDPQTLARQFAGQVISAIDATHASTWRARPADVQSTLERRVLDTVTDLLQLWNPEAAYTQQPSATPDEVPPLHLVIVESNPQPCQARVHRPTWCDQPHADGTDFCCYPEDDVCACGIRKHHVHCQHGLVTQVG